MKEDIEKMVNEFELNKNAIMVGKTENISEYLFASDLMIHSSRGEGISNAILEGMFAGLPVIATNVGGVPETVFPGHHYYSHIKIMRLFINVCLNRMI